MSAWLLGVAGIVIIGVLVELLLSDSVMSKFIRSIYGFFILLVIVQPLPALVKNAAVAVNGGAVVELHSELLATINAQTAAALQKNAEDALEVAGFEGVIVTVDYDKRSMAFSVLGVYVNAFGLVLREQKSAIDIEKSVVEIVCAVCRVDEEEVFYAC